MSLFASHQIPEPPQGGEIKLKNISSQDFQTSYLDEANKRIEVTIPAKATRIFPLAIGTIILNHLAHHLLNVQNFSYRTDVNVELDRLKKKIIQSQ